MYAGRMQSIRQHVLWQASVILADKPFDQQEFVRSGSFGEPRGSSPVMSDETREKVETFQGCINRGLPEPNFESSTWRDDAEAAFKAHDEATGIPR